MEAWAHRLRSVASSAASGCMRRAFHCAAPYAASRGRPEPRPATLLRRPIGQAPRRWCRNVHLLCIGYAFRPRLSPRLTLGGLASPRKPWVYGGGVTLAALVTHASILTSGRSTAGRPRGFSAGRKAPLPIVIRLSRRFGAMLSPVYCRRMSTRPVSCYALFK